MPLRIGNGAGFWGDNIDAPRRLVERAELDYLTLEYLAELSMSILARQREKDPRRGYAGDFLDVLRSLLPALRAQPRLRIVTNAGGMNPRGCADAAAEMLTTGGLAATTIGVVSGDDLLPRLDALQRDGCTFAHLDTGEQLSAMLARTPHSAVVCANAYLEARPIAEALAGGARVVITGRVADASLTVGPAMHEYGWKWNDWDRLAGASAAGHLIECGAQCTGGYHAGWRDWRLTDVGYPIAELDEDGSSLITKPDGTGGAVNRRTVAAQLVYEIGDPAHYLTPDVDVDFTAVDLAELGDDRVRVSGARGRPAPDSYKVSLAYSAGFMASGQLLVFGRDCREKARACAEIVFARLHAAGWEPEQRHVELLGAGDGVPGIAGNTSRPEEVMLRIAVRDPRRECVERFTKELAPLITSGPAGLGGYAASRSEVRPVYAYWPTLVPKALVAPRVEYLTCS